MKNHQDTIQRFVFENTPVRGNFVNLTQTLQEALHQQTIPTGLKCALGELMAASALLAATLKMNGALVMQIQSKGALKLLVVECTSEAGATLKIRATAKWRGDITDQQNLFELLEHGQFMITLDPKDGNQAYQGIVALEGDSISTVLENYMLRSEQIDTKIWLCCDGHSAAGMLIQKLPETMNQVTKTYGDEDVDTWNRVGHLADTVTNEELLQLPAETLLTRLFHQEDVRLYEGRTVAYHCPEDWPKIRTMLRNLGAEELRAILDEQGEILVKDEICHREYRLDAAGVEQLLNPSSDHTLH